MALRAAVPDCSAQRPVAALSERAGFRVNCKHMLQCAHSAGSDAGVELRRRIAPMRDLNPAVSETAATGIEK
jgi:hypothetical protein